MDSFRCCPLTKERFQDPVIDPEGNTYERSAIEEWLKDHSTSPITRSPLTLEQLVPNRALFDAISSSSVHLPPPPPLVDEWESVSVPHGSPGLSATIVGSNSILERKTLLSVDVVAPASTKRTPTHIVLVIDVSGSMGCSADVQGASESTGLSVLDITKHAAKTAIKLLSPLDTLSVVKFDSNASVVFDSMPMSVLNMKQAIKVVEELHPGSSTNLWDGLLKGMQQVKKSNVANKFSSVFLLTDGVPNIEPPRGHIPMMQKFMDENPNLKFSVNTFGFGYNLMSSLLLEIALNGGGNYSFIPDASFVGTVFVHSVSNELCKFGVSAVLKVETSNSSGVVLGASGKKQLKTLQTSWGYLIDVGSLSFDQTRSFVMTFDGPVSVDSVTLSYHDLNDGVGQTSELVTTPSLSPSTNPSINHEILRLLSVDAITDGLSKYDGKRMRNLSEAQSAIASVVSTIKSSDSPASAALTIDMTGQITEAFSKSDYADKWGVHYLPSICRAHLLQVCTNFKDPGLQKYAEGTLFEKLRNEGDDIFMAMPAPKPSHGGERMNSANFSRTYYNASNGCFHGNCDVTLEGGMSIKMRDLKKGDRVVGTGGAIVEVLCIMKTLVGGSKCDMVTLSGGLCATPYHPIFYEGKWQFPRDITTPAETACDAVYSFVIKGGTGILVNGIEGIALGHNIVDDPIASHPYFGTDNIVEDLKKLRSLWEHGLVVFDYGCMRREEDNNTETLIVGFHMERLVLA